MAAASRSGRRKPRGSRPPRARETPAPSCGRGASGRRGWASPTRTPPRRPATRGRGRGFRPPPRVRARATRRGACRALRAIRHCRRYRGMPRSARRAVEPATAANPASAGAQKCRPDANSAASCCPSGFPGPRGKSARYRIGSARRPPRLPAFTAQVPIVFPGRCIVNWHLERSLHPYCTCNRPYLPWNTLSTVTAKTHEGHVALVTGAAQGIGQAIALELARRGAVVIATDLNLPHETVAKIGRGAHGIHLDVTREEAWRSVALESRQVGEVDIVVNNAGYFPNRPIDELDLATWRRTLATNLDAHFLSAKFFLPAMRKKKWGRFIGIASNMVGLAMPRMSHSTPSKVGAVGFMRGLANDVAGDGIT